MRAGGPSAPRALLTRATRAAPRALLLKRHAPPPPPWLRRGRFVPNGGRSYYSVPGRSQPPLLSSMVAEVFHATGNLTFLNTAYAALKTEWAWWAQSGEYGHAVTVAAPGTAGAAPSAHTLNRYVTDQHIPRPESWCARARRVLA